MPTVGRSRWSVRDRRTCSPLRCRPRGRSIWNLSLMCALPMSEPPDMSCRVISRVRPMRCSGSDAIVSPRSTCWNRPGARTLYQCLERHLSLTVRATVDRFGWFSLSAIEARPPTGAPYLMLAENGPGGLGSSAPDNPAEPLRPGRGPPGSARSRLLGPAEWGSNGGPRTSCPSTGGAGVHARGRPHFDVAILGPARKLSIQTSLVPLPLSMLGGG